MSVITDRYTTALISAQGRNELNEHGFYRRGKFEGQQPLTAALYELANDGGANDQASDAQDRRELYGFRLTDEESKALNYAPFLIVIEHGDGSVGMDEYESEAIYEAQFRHADNPLGDEGTETG